MLYKNKYLIALVDPKTENIMGACDNTNDVLNYLGFDKKEIDKKFNTLKVFISNAFNNNNVRHYVYSKSRCKYYIEFVEARKIHNDIFKQEDIEFNKFIYSDIDIKKSENIDYLKSQNRKFYKDLCKKFEIEKIF